MGRPYVSKMTPPGETHVLQHPRFNLETQRAYNVTPKARCRSQVDTIVQNLSSSVYFVGDYLGIDGFSPDCTVGRCVLGMCYVLQHPRFNSRFNLETHKPVRVRCLLCPACLELMVAGSVFVFKSSSTFVETQLPR